MLRTALLAAVLLATPLAALASSGYYAGDHRRVVVTEPRVAVSIGAPHGGFNVYYQSGGYYAPATPVYYRAPVIVQTPYYPPHRVQHYPVHHDWHGGGRHHRHGYYERNHGRGHGYGRGHDHDDD
jgi:hypothetical protein